MIWIHNITPDDRSDSEPNVYAVKLNRKTLVEFEHDRDRGAAECFRAAADALDAKDLDMKHDNGAETWQELVLRMQRRK